MEQAVQVLSGCRVEKRSSDKWVSAGTAVPAEWLVSSELLGDGRFGFGRCRFGFSCCIGRRSGGFFSRWRSGIDDRIGRFGAANDSSQQSDGSNSTVQACELHGHIPKAKGREAGLGHQQSDRQCTPNMGVAIAHLAVAKCISLIDGGQR